MSRYFLIEEIQAENELVETLVDQRVLHLMRRGYSDQLSPGMRFNLYALDYGTFVNFENGLVQPKSTRDHDYATIAGGVCCNPFGDDRVVPRVVVDLSTM
jgi:hypothetical protein